MQKLHMIKALSEKMGNNRLYIACINEQIKKNHIIHKIYKTGEKINSSNNKVQKKIMFITLTYGMTLISTYVIR